jgi:hypothetical protein
MYLARFSYEISPVDRQQAIDFIRREVKAALDRGLHARLLVPLTRSHGGPALQFEIQVTDFEQLENFRHRGVGSDKDTRDWMHQFSKVLLSPPAVEIMRVGEAGG